MLTAEQNDLLSRVEGDAPMGRLIREHSWIPYCLSNQLEIDGAPRRVRLLGQDYVSFRDSEGTVGFLDERCPHRSVSLVLARNENCALTCIFHGWKIDVTGQVVEAATHQPNPEAFAAKVRTRNYPVVDTGGLVWVWLSDSEAPPFPHLPFTTLPKEQVWLTSTHSACNWLQGVEATLDTAQVGTLHKAYIEVAAAKGGDATIGETLSILAPRYDVERGPHGLDAIGIRPMPDGGTYIRTTRWVAPMVSLVPGDPGVGGVGVIFIASPIDDHNHNLFFGFWSGEEVNDGRYESVPESQEFLVGDLPFDFENFGGFSGTRDNNWAQDRDAMQAGHFTGFTGNLLQEDIVTQVSMGAIVDRTKEHLSSSDVAIIHARRVLFDALKNIEDGRSPYGAEPGHGFADLYPIDHVIAPSSGNVTESVEA